MANRAMAACMLVVGFFHSGCSSDAGAPCASSRDCSSGGLVCDLAAGVCVECVGDVDCLGDTEQCLMNRCVERTPCSSSRQCPGLVCDTDRGFCVECLGDIDCADGGRCTPEGACAAPSPSCASDEDCADPLVCDPSSMRCAECVDHADCAAGSRCDDGRCRAAASDGGEPRDGGEPTEDAGPRMDAGLSADAAVVGDGGTAPGEDASTSGDAGLGSDSGTAVADGCVASAETCDGLDEDCDGRIDEALSAPTCTEQRGVCAGSTRTCGGSSGWLSCGASRYGASYEASETSCDGLDNDCDGTADEGCVTSCSVPGSDCGSQICACPSSESTCSGTGECRPLEGSYTIRIEDGVMPVLHSSGDDWDPYDAPSSRPDPYVAVFVGATHAGSTPEVDNTFYPSWTRPDGDVTVLLNLGDDVQLDVYDDDLIDADDFMFGCVLTVTESFLRTSEFTCRPTSGSVSVSGRILRNP